MTAMNATTSRAIHTLRIRKCMEDHTHTCSSCFSTLSPASLICSWDPLCIDPFIACLDFCFPTAGFCFSCMLDILVELTSALVPTYHTIHLIYTPTPNQDDDDDDNDDNSTHTAHPPWDPSCTASLQHTAHIHKHNTRTQT